ncbi:bifunctional ADP-dependent NAD(P)H-hydrate dehydratase/NAD(P)H-hydrate epimerase [Thalassotalea sp. ND16A]|uniref:bifunctional ADP-dependent NAD(P)H-hydrate dehydratase/NAD(P)H-hydrate epimerase n=1 Tax=Thalassotalea sp. ND16A TaxID=1535422 RepID=UPI00051A054C|nr:bifunctional ADP-dependent NAD(P)H-hydrate dehydratase/NAD(P)H-hydrate epimerase [Thalassotalea sp. ND16A]KGJ88169.1 hypothetical protein ND16A_2722 [Thalassotalea sp. ND16A]
MLPVKFLASIPQHAYHSEMVARNEGAIARQQQLTLYQLMVAAGQSAFELLQQQWPACNTVLVVCGRGNNAGDGFVLARLALQFGMRVYLHSLAALDDYQGDAKLASQQFIDAGGRIDNIDDIDLNGIDVIIDAMLGTGIKGAVRDNFRSLIELINAHDSPVLSLDLPSGLNANTGQVQGCAIVADITVTFVAMKIGLLTGKANDYCGQLYLAGLGIAQQFAKQIASKTSINAPAHLTPLATRQASAHKGNSGFVLTIAGNKGMPGAARLASEAALRAGAGLVAVACHRENQVIITATRPELMLADLEVSDGTDHQQKLTKVDAVVLGPGLGSNDWAETKFRQALALNKPMVVDADGLNLLAEYPQYRDNWVLTPHPGEAARLLNTSVTMIEADRFSAVKAIAVKYGGICVLKGAGSLISDGDSVAINITGNAGMAVGGMGDVLAGILGALILQSDNIYTAAKYAVHIHGKAADMAIINGQKGLLASDLFPFIRQLVNQ